ncbi:MAG: phenylalanine--tRNA ligase subunit beta, partial [Epsilonproteobacteria bacterium]
MIVTKSWLSEFIELNSVSNETLYETFNAIGLEVDSIKTVDIPEKVVVGKILSCEKHPNADKLNVCQVDIGGTTRQIVCGAANVVYAKYVAVALMGAILPDAFEIKFATLRGVDSEGMICASSELGLPDTGKGIMILDESIGELKIGQELGSYDRVADTIIELELTANRGDCLSIHGVARDLSVALDRELIPFEYHNESREKLGIARVADIHIKGDIEADLCYGLATAKQVNTPLLITL